MPSYQNAMFIGAAIESVLAQTFTDTEIVVVDSSTDGTAAVLAGFGARITVIRTEPRGISPARNAGIRAARGRYIAFLDADDEWLPSKLEKQIALLERDERVGLVCTDVLFKDGRGPRPGRAFVDAPPASGMIYPVVFTRSFIGTLAVVVRRACFDDVGVFDEAITACEDHDLWLRISRRWAIDYVDEPLAVYRYSADQASADRERTLNGVASKPDSGMIKVQQRAYASSPELRALDQPALDLAFFDLYLELAKLYVLSGRPALARPVLRRYRRLRGATRRYMKLWAASWLPPGLLRKETPCRS